jgi:hypothetical protein
MMRLSRRRIRQVFVVRHELLAPVVKPRVGQARSGGARGGCRWRYGDFAGPASGRGFRSPKGGAKSQQERSAFERGATARSEQMGSEMGEREPKAT